MSIQTLVGVGSYEPNSKKLLMALCPSSGHDADLEVQLQQQLQIVSKYVSMLNLEGMYTERGRLQRNKKCTE